MKIILLAVAVTIVYLFSPGFAATLRALPNDNNDFHL
jgi:hypothetical protein